MQECISVDFRYAVGENQRCDRRLRRIDEVIDERRRDALDAVGYDDLGRVAVVPDENVIEYGERAVLLVQPADKLRSGKRVKADIAEIGGQDDFRKRRTALEGSLLNFS